MSGTPVPTCQPVWSDTTNAYDSWTITDARDEYRDDFTTQGYRTDVSCGGGTYSIDRITAHSLGQEECPPTGTDTDWNETEDSPAPINAWTLTGIGGYAGSGCFFGHWVTAEGQATMVDSYTGLNADGIGGFYHCYLLYPTPPGSGTPPGC